MHYRLLRKNSAYSHALLSIYYLAGLAMLIGIPSIGQEAKNVRIVQDTNAATTYRAWSFPVFYSARQPSVQRTAAKLSRTLRLPSPTAAVTNPVCSFWIEMDEWQPTPRVSGYVVLLQPGGAIMRGTDLEQIDKAISHLASASRIVEGRVHLPLNALLSNYPVIQPSDAP